MRRRLPREIQPWFGQNIDPRLRFTLPVDCASNVRRRQHLHYGRNPYGQNIDPRLRLKEVGKACLWLDDRQQQENMRGVWLYEIADLAGMSKADVDKVKAFASRLADRARPAYGRQRVEQLRRCIFFATTNDDTYLKSQTGNRRFWPVKTGTIGLAALRRDRDHLGAEAV